MLDYAQVNTAITEAGPLDEEILAIARIADDRWLIQFEPIMIEAEYAPHLGRLVLSGAAGTLSTEQRAEHLEMMLGYATLWRETGGLRLALYRDSDEVVLMMDLADAQIETQTIATVAKNLALRCLMWKGALAAPADSLIQNPSPDFIKI